MVTQEQQVLLALICTMVLIGSVEQVSTHKILSNETIRIDLGSKTIVNETVPLNSKVIIKCNFDFPTWFKNDAQVPIDRRSAQSLKLEAIKNSDAGYYSCRSELSEWSNITLSVLGQREAVDHSPVSGDELSINTALSTRVSDPIGTTNSAHLENINNDFTEDVPKLLVGTKYRVASFIRKACSSEGCNNPTTGMQEIHEVEDPTIQHPVVINHSQVPDNEELDDSDYSHHDNLYGVYEESYEDRLYGDFEEGFITPKKKTNDKPPVNNAEISPLFTKQENMIYNISKSVGDIVRLQCRAHGNPMPNVTWTKDNDKIVRGNVSTKYTKWSILLQDLVSTDSGNYTCYVCNFIGCVNFTSKLEVLDVIVDGPFLQNSPTPQHVGQNSALISIVITVISGCFIILAITVVIVCNKLKRGKNKLRKVEQWTKKVVVLKPSVIENSITGMTDAIQLPTVHIEKKLSTLEQSGSCDLTMLPEYEFPIDFNWEFSRNKLFLSKSLGEGAFGRVVMAEAQGIFEKTTTTVVAVKMLKEGHTDSDVKDLVCEMEVMKMIGRHANIINLLGCCCRNGPLYVIVEYAPHGNLKDFLRGHRFRKADDEAVTHNNVMNMANNKKIITQEELVSFAYQISLGMEHLASRRCIHRDLAARNVLVSDGSVMKIADFGLARDIHSREYYRKTTAGMLPIRWMAPESLEEMYFDSQSDVWSYGVLLWEIMTLGGYPYPMALSWDSMLDHLKKGKRLEQPPLCSMDIYLLMNECWQYQPEMRATFSEIARKLNPMCNNTANEAFLYRGLPQLEPSQWLKKVTVLQPPAVCSISGGIETIQMPIVRIEEQYSSQAQSKTRDPIMMSNYEFPIDLNWEYPRNKLLLGRSLGEGAFGKVYMAEAQELIKGQSSTVVAVKMLKEGHTDADIKDLVCEMEVMKFIGKHGHIINLLGCCCNDGPLNVIVEYATHGSLLDFLQKHQFETKNNEVVPNGYVVSTIKQKQMITPKELVSFAYQIALGMEHLASKKCIHRDLAARNVLVSDGYVMKISDFGLTRNIYSREYYRKTTTGLLPFRWMAPESLSELYYDYQSDVWSFGVLLWEILTLGDHPYSDILTWDDMIDFLNDGNRLEQPSFCSMDMYLFMNKCWHYKPEVRPTFKEIVLHLDRILHMTPDEEFLERAPESTSRTKKVTVFKPPVNDGGKDAMEIPIISIEEQISTQIKKGYRQPKNSSDYQFPIDLKWEFPHSKLHLSRDLGEGTFGRVVIAEAEGLVKGQVSTIVAVKMLKDGHTDADVKDLVCEMEVMKMIGKHVNIINLLGCCCNGGPLYVIVEYALHGNMLDFLLKYQFETVNDDVTANGYASNIVKQKKTILHHELVSFAHQIALGMEHLASRRCIHRDLAARNVLVSDNLVMKIADFGLARDIHDREYYRKTTIGLLPFRWMAPESLEELYYDSKSDVWSFGVLLWEIMTLGGHPYSSIMTWDNMRQHLQEGQRLQQPTVCPIVIYQCMRECWHNSPEKRPSFSQIVLQLGRLTNNTFNKEYLDLGLVLQEMDPNNEAVTESRDNFIIY